MPLTIDDFVDVVNKAHEEICPTIPVGLFIEAHKRAFNTHCDKMESSCPPKPKPYPKGGVWKLQSFAREGVVSYGI